jgi:hypothetical protein
MSRRPARFTEADLFRAAKAAKRAGMAVEALADGTIRLVLDRARDQVPPETAEPAPQPLC